MYNKKVRSMGHFVRPQNDQHLVFARILLSTEKFACV